MKHIVKNIYAGNGAPTFEVNDESYYIQLDGSPDVITWHAIGDTRIVANSGGAKWVPESGAALPDGSVGTAQLDNESVTEAKLDPTLATKIDGKADESEVVLIDGQSPAGALVIGTDNAQSVAIKTNGNNHIVIDSIGNVGIGVDNPEAPLAVAGAITVAAGSVSTEWNPTSGTNLTAGTVSSHPLVLIANGTTILTLGTDGSTTSAGDLHMSEKKVINIADGSDPRDAVNKQQLDVKLTAIQGAAQADSAASDVAGLVADFNALLAKLRTAGIIAT